MCHLKTCGTKWQISVPTWTPFLPIVAFVQGTFHVFPSNPMQLHGIPRVSMALHQIQQVIYGIPWIPPNSKEFHKIHQSTGKPPIPIEISGIQCVWMDFHWIPCEFMKTHGNTRKYIVSWGNFMALHGMTHKTMKNPLTLLHYAWKQCVSAVFCWIPMHIWWNHLELHGDGLVALEYHALPREFYGTWMRFDRGPMEFHGIWMEFWATPMEFNKTR